MFFRVFILTGWILLLSEPGYTIGGDPPIGGRSAGLANASVMLTDYWSLFHNQAGLAFFSDPKVGIHHKQGFIKQLSHQALGVVLPAGNGSIGGSFTYFGFSAYHEIKTGLTYSMLLDEKLAGSVQLDYFYTHIDGYYGNGHVVSSELGLIYLPFDKLYIGTHVFNPLPSSQLGQGKKLPTIFRIGAAYQVQQELLVTLESEKNLVKAFRMKAGLEYEIIDAFFLRTGITTNPVMNSFGIGYTWKEMVLDVSFTRHMILGFSPQFSLNYSF